MKKALVCLVISASMLSYAGCSKSENNVTEMVTETTTEATEVIVPNSVAEDSEECIAVKETVANFLDTFISADFELIKNAIHEDDQWCFNFESESQLAFYNAIFPQIEYEFEYVSEYEGVYGVMTQITSPDMAEVYGTIFTDTLSSATGENSHSVNEILTSTTETMVNMLNSGTLSKRVERLYIYVEYIDGEYIPRCDMYLANELTGGAPEVSDELYSTLSDSANMMME